MRATPPTLRALLEDATFRRYMKTIPRPHPLMQHGNPWQVWVRTTEGRWRTGLYPDYASAWRTAIAQMRKPEMVGDVCVTSRRVLFAQPENLEIPRGLTWCPRCRRPSYWAALSRHHHALKNQPAVAEDENHRCMFCGIRMAGLGSVFNWVDVR